MWQGEWLGNSARQIGRQPWRWPVTRDIIDDASCESAQQPAEMEPRAESIKRWRADRDFSREISREGEKRRWRAGDPSVPEPGDGRLEALPLIRQFICR